MSEPEAVSIKPIVPEGQRFYVVGYIHHSEWGSDGYLTHWKTDTSTGKQTRKYRRFIGALADQ